MSSNDKKDATFPALRISAIMSRRVYAAFDRMGINMPNFRRRLIEDIIRIVESGETVALPPRIMTAKEKGILDDVIQNRTKNK
jgi:hypothetical protein